MAESTDDELVLRDLVPVEPLLPEPGLPGWAWVLIVLAVAGLAALALLKHRGKKAAAADPLQLREEAYAAAVRELESAPETAAGIQTAATGVSLILRRYLATVCSDPALFETHEEFISRHAALSGYPAELRDAAAEGFSHLARLKYGRDANGDPATLFFSARQLLDRLHQHQPA